MNNFVTIKKIVGTWPCLRIIIWTSVCSLFQNSSGVFGSVLNFSSDNLGCLLTSLVVSPIHREERGLVALAQHICSNLPKTAFFDLILVLRNFHFHLGLVSEKIKTFYL